MTADTTPMRHTVKTTPIPSLVGTLTLSFHIAGSGIQIMIKVVTTFGIDRYRQRVRPGIAHFPGPSGFQLLEKGLQFAKGMMTWMRRTARTSTKVALMTMRVFLDVRPRMVWRRDRMPSLVREVVRGQMIWRAVWIFNMWTIVGGERAAV